MKITAILGSPRKGGNSETIAEAFLQEAEALGAEVSRSRLNGLSYRPCQACNACKVDNPTDCVLRDDLNPVLDAVAEADVLLIASPIYFLDLSAATKAFIDRLYYFFKPDYHSRPDMTWLAPGKQLVLITSQRASDAWFLDVLKRYRGMFYFFGFHTAHAVRGCLLGDDKNAAAAREDLLEEARASARRVVAQEPPTWEIPPYAVVDERGNPVA